MVFIVCDDEKCLLLIEVVFVIDLSIGNLVVDVVMILF